MLSFWLVAYQVFFFTRFRLACSVVQFRIIFLICINALRFIGRRDGRSQGHILRWQDVFAFSGL